MEHDGKKFSTNVDLEKLQGINCVLLKGEGEFFLVKTFISESENLPAVQELKKSNDIDTIYAFIKENIWCVPMEMDIIKTTV